jgi:hypothetical protein
MENAHIGNNLSKDELDQRTSVALNKIRDFVRSLDAKLPGSKDYGRNDVDQVSSFTSGP